MTDSAHGSSAPQEPKTPMWLPAVGAVLFIVGGIWITSTSSDTEADTAAESAEAAEGDAGAPQGH